eukprot:comp11791_c0_seq1/m.6398 comp11791_c0_seq1/g.6398  ORF comp11791_c0_seq1/g.6398 comp11791_c0_seq1/m.6398 type:complete len:219 (-) comp11791_c0_seq1:294-950(-)
MATEASHKRLQREFLKISRDPPPYITAVPLPSNILEWHFCVAGPENTVYQGGYYHGRLIFPKEYPYKPPAIMMITPSGRFKCNARLCLSLSDFHPENWNPNWGVSTALVGLLSFMLETTPTTGSIETTDQRKRELAWLSADYNINNPKFRLLFPELTEKLEKEAERRRRADMTSFAPQLTSCQAGGRSTSQLNSSMANLALALLTVIFAYIVVRMLGQ